MYSLQYINERKNLDTLTPESDQLLISPYNITPESDQLLISPYNITPESDQLLISPYNITPESSIKVTRIKDMTNNL